jgi:hypothetical protein
LLFHLFLHPAPPIFFIQITRLSNRNLSGSSVYQMCGEGILFLCSRLVGIGFCLLPLFSPIISTRTDHGKCTLCTLNFLGSWGISAYIGQAGQPILHVRAPKWIIYPPGVW